MDKKSIEYVAAALATAPKAGLVSLRLDDCLLRPAALEALGVFHHFQLIEFAKCRHLAHAVRTSSLRNISLRHNRITATGAVALALMIKDYPDTIPTNNSLQIPSTPSANTGFLTPPLTPSATPPQPVSPLSSTNTLPKVGPVLPPPRHPKPATPQTTYTPYVPRSKRGASSAASSNGPLSPPLPGAAIPIITSNAQGGITTRHSSTPVTPSSTPTTATAPNGLHQGPSAALLDKVRALDTLPRLGALRTLDLKGNDIRVSLGSESLNLCSSR
jgi:protein phosphatase 1 regulatory subunit 37